jgi:hypothetical protein
MNDFCVGMYVQCLMRMNRYMLITEETTHDVRG